MTSLVLETSRNNGEFVFLQVAVITEDWKALCQEQSRIFIKSIHLTNLTQYGLMTPNGVIDTDQHWFRYAAWQNQAMILTSADLSITGCLGISFGDFLFKILCFSLRNEEVHSSSVKRWPFYLGLNVFTLSLRLLYWHCGISMCARAILLTDMAKIDRYQSTTKYCKAWTVTVILGMLCVGRRLTNMGWLWRLYPVSRIWISNCIPRYSVTCNYSYMP